MFDLSPQEITAIGLSVKVASVATLASLPLAVFIAYALARWRFPGHAALNALVHLPLVLPPVVTGFALLLLFGRHGPIGAFLAQHLGLIFAFRWTGAALAAAIMSFPLMIRPIRLSFENVDRRLGDAARSLLAPIPCGPSSSLPCRWPRRASSSARSSVSQKRSENLAQPSPLSRTFQAKRRRFPPQSTASCKPPAETRRRSALQPLPRRSLSLRWLSPKHCSDALERANDRCRPALLLRGFSTDHRVRNPPPASLRSSARRAPERPRWRF